jgi:hypothetical protein
LYPLPNIIRAMKWGKIRCRTCSTHWTGENACTILVGNPEGKRPMMNFRVCRKPENILTTWALIGSLRIFLYRFTFSLLSLHSTFVLFSFLFVLCLLVLSKLKMSKFCSHDDCYGPCCFATRSDPTSSVVTYPAALKR